MQELPILAPIPSKQMYIATKINFSIAKFYLNYDLGSMTNIILDKNVIFYFTIQLTCSTVDRQRLVWLL